MRRSLAVSLLALAVSLGGGCGKEKGESPANAVENPPIETVEPPPEDTRAAEPSSLEGLQGQWESNCTDTVLFGLTENASLEVAGTQARKAKSFYSTGDCQNEAIRVEQRARLSDLGEATTGITNLDVTVEHIRVTPVSETGVAILRLSNFCGIADWKLNEFREIAPEVDSSRCFPKIPTKIFDIYAIEGEKVYFGNDDDMARTASRPTQLYRDRFFSRISR